MLVSGTTEPSQCTPSPASVKRLSAPSVARTLSNRFGSSLTTITDRGTVAGYRSAHALTGTIAPSAADPCAPAHTLRGRCRCPFGGNGGRVGVLKHRLSRRRCLIFSGAYESRVLAAATVMGRLLSIGSVPPSAAESGQIPRIELGRAEHQVTHRVVWDASTREGPKIKIVSS